MPLPPFTKKVTIHRRNNRHNYHVPDLWADHEDVQSNSFAHNPLLLDGRSSPYTKDEEIDALIAAGLGDIKQRLIPPEIRSNALMGIKPTKDQMARIKSGWYMRFALNNRL